MSLERIYVSTDTKQELLREKLVGEDMADTVKRILEEAKASRSK